MSENIFEPNPAAGNESNDALDFDFSQLTPEVTEPIGEHEIPNHNADKKPWWKTKSKSGGERKEEKKRSSSAGNARMSDAALRIALENFYSGMSLLAMPLCSHCAMNIGNNASQCAEAMVEWSKTNPAIRRFLVSMVAVSAGGKVIAAHAAMIAPIMMHHVPALRERQEKAIGDMAEMFANMSHKNGTESE